MKLFHSLVLATLLTLSGCSAINENARALIEKLMSEQRESTDKHKFVISGRLEFSVEPKDKKQTAVEDEKPAAKDERRK